MMINRHFLHTDTMNIDRLTIIVDGTGKTLHFFHWKILAKEPINMILEKIMNKNKLKWKIGYLLEEIR